MACKCLIYACDVIINILIHDLHISKWGNYGIGIIMFYIYIGEVYRFKLGCVIEIGYTILVGCSRHVKYTWICVIRPISMHNCRSTRQQRLQKEEITRNRSDNDSLSFRSITKIAAIHNPNTTQKMTDRNRSCAGLWTITTCTKSDAWSQHGNQA